MYDNDPVEKLAQLAQLDLEVANLKSCACLPDFM